MMDIDLDAIETMIRNKVRVKTMKFTLKRSIKYLAKEAVKAKHYGNYKEGEKAYKQYLTMIKGCRLLLESLDE